MASNSDVKQLQCENALLKQSLIEHNCFKEIDMTDLYLNLNGSTDAEKRTEIERFLGHLLVRYREKERECAFYGRQVQEFLKQQGMSIPFHYPLINVGNTSENLEIKPLHLNCDVNEKLEQIYKDLCVVKTNLSVPNLQHK